jgi:hypothetical protein
MLNYRIIHFNYVIKKKKIVIMFNFDIYKLLDKYILI